MITATIEPQSATYVLHLPQEYINQRVEISIALATDKPQTSLRESALRACGVLSGAITDPMQWQRELRNELDAQ